MHANQCNECQTCLTEDLSICLWDLLCTVIVIHSFDLEDTFLTLCSWKSAQMLRTYLIPYLYLNFKAKPPPKQTSLVTRWKFLQVLRENLFETSISCFSMYYLLLWWSMSKWRVVLYLLCSLYGSWILTVG